MITNSSKNSLTKHLTDIFIIQKICLSFYLHTQKKEWIENFEWWVNREKEIKKDISELSTG